MCSAALAVKKLLGDIPANIKVNGSHLRSELPEMPKLPNTEDWTCGGRLAAFSEAAFAPL
jgi:hypothetical protein